MNKNKPATPQEAMENLLNAVVAQAAKDYRSACKKLRKKPDDKKALKLKQETEDFFSTDRVRLYTHYSGVKLLQMLKKEQAELDRQEEIKKQEELKKQEEMNERKRISGTVSEENGTDRSLAGQNCRNTRLRRKMHFRAQPHTGR